MKRRKVFRKTDKYLYKDVIIFYGGYNGDQIRGRMAFQRRIYLVFLGFLGLLVSIGFRSVFSMVMVHVVKSKHAEEEGLFGKVGVIFRCGWRQFKRFLIFIKIFINLCVLSIMIDLLKEKPCVNFLNIHKLDR